MNSVKFMQLTASQRLIKVHMNENPQVPTTTKPMGYDTISFKGGTEKIVKSNTVKKWGAAVLATLAGLFAAKNATNKTEVTEQATKPIPKITKPLTESEKLAETLRSQPYIYTAGRDGDITVVEDKFNNTAVNGIVEVYEKQGNEAAYRLAKHLENNGKASAEGTQYLIEIFKTEPELLDKYSYVDTKYAKKFLKIDEKAKLIQASKINTEHTDKVLNLLSKSTGNLNYGEIYDFVEKAQNYPTVTVSKYLDLDEKRISLELDDILELSALDEKYSKEIDELIVFIKSKDLASDTYSIGKDIPKIVEDYAANPESVKGIITLLRRTDPEKIKNLVDAYNLDPEITEKICKKIAEANHVSTGGVDTKEVAALSTGIIKHGNTINLLTGKDWQSLSKKELNEVIKTINENSEIINKILEDGHYKNYPFEGLIDIYKRNPNRKITKEFIDLSNDPLAKLFNLP